MEVCGQLHTPATLPPGKASQYPLERRLGGPQHQSGYSGEEKNSQYYTTELSQLFSVLYNFPKWLHMASVEQMILA
jgi:hypothetical protein